MDADDLIRWLGAVGCVSPVAFFFYWIGRFDGRAEERQRACGVVRGMIAGAGLVMDDLETKGRSR